MEIAIFKEVTTEGVITSIEENSKKYHDGLYADMNNLPERTMVKKGAAEIGDIIKQLKTSRIAITKANTAAVNKEHDAIVERLAVANKPFTDLLDAYNAERKVILDTEKARKQKVIDDALYENDHEMGLLINKTFEYDRQQKEQERIAYDLAVVLEAEKNAAENKIRINEAKERDRVNEENARLADTEYKGRVNSMILLDLVQCGITEAQAKTIVIAIAKKQITQTTINY
jgi:hypothetical protein